MIKSWLPLLAALTCAASCSDAIEAPGDHPVRIVRGVSREFPAMPPIPAPVMSLVPAPLDVARLEESFDVIADARDEASQTEARSRDLYRIADSIVAEDGTVPEV